MARPVPRRRAEREAPDADKYASRTTRGRAAAEEEPAEERRPRAGRARGELPGRAAAEETPRRGRRAAAPDPVEDALPASVEEIESLGDEEYDELLVKFDVPEGLEEDEEVDALWEAIQAASKPVRSSRRAGRVRGADTDADGTGDDLDDKPRGRGRRAAAADEEEDKPRGRGRGRTASRDEDDEDGEADDAPKRKPRGGFEGYKTTKSKTYTGDFKLTPELLLVKFLEDEPFDSYAEHGLYNELKDGQRVWVCIEDGCPICNTGHKPRAIALWNIIVMPEQGEPHVEVLRAGPMLSKEIEKKASLKTGPMSKEYYCLAQPEQKKNEAVIPPIVELVRERDVKEEWDTDPFTDDELEEFFEQTPDPEGFIKFPSLRQVKDIARKLIND